MRHLIQQLIFAGIALILRGVAYWMSKRLFGQETRESEEGSQ